MALAPPNPTKFLKTVILYNEFRSLGEERFYNESVYRFILPKGKLKFQFTLPLDLTDAAGPVEGGFGDAGLKISWLPKLTREYGLVFSLDTFWPTATKDLFGSGKYVVSSGVTYARFIGNKIFAPSLQQKLSAADAGDDRDDILQTQVDLYFVWKPTKTQWLIIDPQTVYDWETDAFFNQTEVEWGRLIGSGTSTYVRPGVSIGGDRPLDWNLEVGLKYVN